MTETPHRHLGEQNDCYDNDCPRFTTKEIGAAAFSALAMIGFIAFAKKAFKV